MNQATLEIAFAATFTGRGRVDFAMREFASLDLMLNTGCVCAGYEYNTDRSVYPLEGESLEQLMTELDPFQASDDINACEGHPAGPHDAMGQTVYCNGTCQ